MSDQDNKFLLILEKISEVSERSARIEAKVEIMERDVSKIKEEDARQNQLLAEHIQGVRTQAARLEEEKSQRREDIDSLDSRVSSLEETPKFLASIKKIAGWVAAVGGAAVLIAKLISKL